MKNYIIKYMPADQIKLCKQDTCIEARGENARTIVAAISIAVILCSIVLHFENQVNRIFERRPLFNFCMMVFFLPFLSTDGKIAIQRWYHEMLKLVLKKITSLFPCFQ